LRIKPITRERTKSEKRDMPPTLTQERMPAPREVMPQELGCDALGFEAEVAAEPVFVAKGPERYNVSSKMKM
jgi:hypothetical protein